MLLNRSRGELGGKPFAQHCSCPAVLRCSVGSTAAAFRELLSYGRIASIAQGQALRSIGKAATSLLPPLTTIHLFSTQETLLQMSLWSRVRALPPLSVPMILPAPEADLPKVMAASRSWV